MIRSSTKEVTMNDVLDVEQVAKMLRISPRTLRNKIHSNKGVPPYIKVGGPVLFLREDVIAWLRGKTVNPTPPTPAPRKRGRPTKAEQIKRARQGG